MPLRDGLPVPSPGWLLARAAGFLQAGHSLLALSLALRTIGFSMSGWSQSPRGSKGEARQGQQPLGTAGNRALGGEGLDFCMSLAFLMGPGLIPRLPHGIIHRPVFESCHYTLLVCCL